MVIVTINEFKFVLLDIDNTLYAYDPAHAAAQAKVVDHIAANSGREVETIRLALKSGRSMTNHRLVNTAASHNRLLYFQSALENLGCCSMPLAWECYSIYWENFLEAMRLYAETASFLESLEPSRACFVTDLTADIQFKKVHRFGWEKYVKFIVTSEEAGAEKPNPVMFRMAMAKLGAEPHECCMVGDSYAKDIVGASALGIHSFWLNGGEQAFAPSSPLVTVINNLRECHD